MINLHFRFFRRQAKRQGEKHSRTLCVTTEVLSGETAVMGHKIFLSVGDPSADLHTARLIRYLKQERADLEFLGIGGPMMEAEGFRSLVPLEQLSTVGFWEVAKRYWFFRSLLQQCKATLVKEEVDLFLPVDFPGFNLKLAHFARKMQIPTLYYIAPQLWAWGKQRAKKLAKAVDLLLVVFPFEESFFKSLGIPTVYVGHPLLDDPRFAVLPRQYEYREDLIVLMPGSRKQEVEHNLPIMLETAVILSTYLPQYSYSIIQSPSLSLDIYLPYLQPYDHLDIDFAFAAAETLQLAKGAMIKVGTSTLEAALLLTPFVTVYKTSWFSYNIAKRLVKIPSVTLVNILLHQSLVPEFIQQEAHPKKIAEALLSLLTDKEYRELVLSEFRNLRSLLGGVGATETVSQIVCEYLDK